MLRVNRKVEYGLVAFKHMMAKPKGQLTSVREICDQYGTPFDPVAHVLRILNAGGLLQSEQGAHGGYRLVENMRNINLAQFIEIVEGHLAFADCLRDEECRCNLMERCNIISPMQMLNNKLLEFLRAISVRELLEEPSGYPGVLDRKDLLPRVQ